MSLRQLNCPEPFTLGSNVSWGSINANDLNLKTLTVNGQPISGGSGVSSINLQTGAVGLLSSDASVTITTTTGQIDFTTSGAVAGVTNLNGLAGYINVISEDSSIGITPNLTNSTLGIVSALTFTGGGSVNVAQSGVNYTIVGAVTTVTGSGAATVTQPTPGTFNVDVPSPPAVPVTSVLAGTNITSVVDVGGAWTVNAPDFPPIPVTSVVAGTNITSVVDAGGAWTVNAPAFPPIPVTSVLAGTNITSVVDVGGAWTVNAAAFSTFVDSFQIYVAPNGNDTMGNGSQQNPYLTITQALVIRGTIATKVSIILSSGVYTESFTIPANTYLVGVSGTGSINSPNVLPTSIVGNILLTNNSASNYIGLANLQVTGNSGRAISLTTAGTYVLYNCSILAASGFNAIFHTTAGSIFLQSCQVTASTVSAISDSAGLEIYNSYITSASASAVISTSGTNLRIMRSTITSSSTSTIASPLIFASLAGTSIMFEIGYCKINYTSAAVDTGGNKCCIQFANTGTYTPSIYNSLLLCEGAITGLGGLIQCIQKTLLGAVTISYGNLLSGATANHISPLITHTSYITVA